MEPSSQKPIMLAMLLLKHRGMTMAMVAYGLPAIDFLEPLWEMGTLDTVDAF